MAWRYIDIDQLITADALTHGHDARTASPPPRPITPPGRLGAPPSNQTQRARRGDRSGAGRARS